MKADIPLLFLTIFLFATLTAGESLQVQSRVEVTPGLSPTGWEVAFFGIAVERVMPDEDVVPTADEDACSPVKRHDLSRVVPVRGITATENSDEAAEPVDTGEEPVPDITVLPDAERVLPPTREEQKRREVIAPKSELPDADVSDKRKEQIEKLRKKRTEKGFRDPRSSY